MKPDQSNRLPHPTEYSVALPARLNVTRLLALFAILVLSLLVCIPSSVYSHQPMSSPPTPGLTPLTVLAQGKFAYPGLLIEAWGL
jgi:hypothetical protein